MIVFIVIDIIILFCIRLLGCKKNLSRCTYLILIIFFLMSGLNYKIHNDYFIYETLYSVIDKKSLTYSMLEKGYVLINLIFNKVLTFYQFKIVVYFVNIVLIYKGLVKIFKKKTTLFVIACLYLYMPFFSIYLSAFRQSISISLFIFSLSYLKDKKILKYLLVTSIAVFFHKSAIFLIFIYFIFSILKINIKTLCVYFCIFSISLFLPIYSIFLDKILKILVYIIPNMGEKITYFKLSFYVSTKETIFYIIFFFIFLIVYRNNKIYRSKIYEFVTKGYLVYCLCYSLERVVPIFYRITPYVTIFYILQFIFIVYAIQNRIIKNIFKYSIVFLFLFYYNLIYIKTANAYDGKYIPFHFYFELLYKDIPYEKTSEYEHLLSRFNTKRINVNMLKQDVIHQYLKK